jgi:hypothetical protein
MPNSSSIVVCVLLPREWVYLKESWLNTARNVCSSLSVTRFFRMTLQYADSYSEEH